MEDKKIIIDGKGAVFGRIASFVAKKALEGNEVVVVNCDKVIMTGNKKSNIEKYEILRKKGGHSQKGPQYPNSSERMLKRGIRGMLPDHRDGNGRDAFKRIRCYSEIPEELKELKMIKITAPKKLKYIELNELAKKI